MEGEAIVRRTAGPGSVPFWVTKSDILSSWMLRLRICSNCSTGRPIHLSGLHTSSRQLKVPTISPWSLPLIMLCWTEYGGVDRARTADDLPFGERGKPFLAAGDRKLHRLRHQGTRSRGVAGLLSPCGADVARFSTRRARLRSFQRCPNRSPDAVPQQSLSAWLLSARGAERLAEASKRSNQGFLAAILACAAKVTGDLTGANEFRVVVPQHTRSELRWATSLGWFIGVVPVRIPITPAATVSDLAKVAGTEMDRVPSRGGPAVFESVRADQLPQHLPFVLSYMDVRHVPGAEQWTSWQTRGLRSRDHSGTDVYIWLTRTPEGLNLAMRHQGDARADQPHP